MACPSQVLRREPSSSAPAATLRVLEHITWQWIQEGLDHGFSGSMTVRDGARTVRGGVLARGASPSATRFVPLTLLIPCSPTHRGSLPH